MRIIRLLVSLFLIIAVQQSVLNGRELQKYKADVTVPILEKDTVYARNNAFQTLQSLILSAAIQDLVGQELFNEYRHQILRNRTLQASKFLVSAKVLEESSDGNYFTMEMEGIIQVSALAEKLHKMNLVLKDDPIIQVALMVESGLKIKKSDLNKRLDRFHVNITNERRVNLSNFPIEERSSKEFAEALFNEASNSKIIYLIDAIPSEDSAFPKAIRTQIFRRSDFALVSTFQLDLPNPIAADEIDAATIGRFSKLFTISSLEIGLYDEGLDSTIVLEVEGLIDPLSRNTFEQQILATNRSIKSFSLIELSVEKASYQLQSKISLKELESFFSRKNSHFYFLSEIVSSSVLLVESFFRYPEQTRQVVAWEPDQRILDLIAQSLGDELVVPETVENNEPPRESIPEKYIPRYLEKEPNNNSQNLNRIPPSTLILGSISSRADEDIFRMIRDIKSSTLVVEWIRIGKTTLSPQLRLYDQHFSVINNYNLVGRQNKLRFQYTFKDAAPHEVFLRVTDKVGYIQGETGGYKTFYYLLKYYWQPEDQLQ